MENFGFYLAKKTHPQKRTGLFDAQFPHLEEKQACFIQIMNHELSIMNYLVAQFPVASAVR